ncbi:integrase core domain protein, partial [Lasius niger]
MYTAFEADGRLYQFLCIPFGATNGVTYFQRVMDQIIKDEDLKGTFPYLDDVTIGGKNQEEHDRNIKRFLDAAEKYNLTLNKDKCQFSVSSVTLLG